MMGKIPKFMGVLAVLMLVFSLAPMLSPEPATAGDLRVTEVSTPEQYEEGDWALAPGYDLWPLAISPNFANDQTLFVGINGGEDFAVLKSDDAGVTWEIVLEDEPGLDVTEPVIAIAISPDYEDDETVYAASWDTIWYSEDGGDEWDVWDTTGNIDPDSGDVVGTIVPGGLDISPAIEGSIAVVIATDNGVYLTGEGHEEFSAREWYDLGDLDLEVLGVAFSPNYQEDEDSLIVAALNDEVTGDIGAVLDVVVSFYFLDAELEDNTIDFDGWNEDGYLADAVLVEDDGGDCDYAAIAFADDFDWEDEAYVYVGIDDSIDDDVYEVEAEEQTIGDFSDVEALGMGDPVASLAISGDRDEATVLAGEADRALVQRCDNPEAGVYADWEDSDREKEPTGETDTCVVMAPNFADDGIAYCTTWGVQGAFQRTENGNVTWEQPSLIDTRIDLLLDEDVASEDVIYLLTSEFGGEESFWVSLNGGDSWLRLLTKEGLAAFKLKAREGAIFVTDIEKIWKTADMGLTWSRGRSAEELISYPGALYAVDAETIFTGDANGNVYRSDDSGASWTEADEKPGNDPVFMILPSLMFAMDGKVLASNDNGQVFLSTDGGQTFEEIPEDGSTELRGGVRAGVVWDINYATNNTIYVFPNDAEGGEPLPFYRFVLGESDDWEEISEDPAVGWFAGAAVLPPHGILYAVDLRTEGQGGVGLVRSVNPRKEDDPEDTFITTNGGLEGDDLSMGRPHFTFSDEGLTLFALAGYQGAPRKLVKYTDTHALMPPTIISPVRGEVVTEFDSRAEMWKVTIRWEAVPDAEGYEVEVHESSDFDSLIPEASAVEDIDTDETESLGASQTSHKTGAYLDGGSQYWCRVRAYDEATGVPGPWGESMFYTGLDSPELSVPENGEREVPVVPAFGWRAVEGATGYKFQLSDDSTFATTIMDETLGKATSIKSAETLEWDTIYFWRVKALRDVVESDWTDAAFNTRPEVLEGPPPPEVTVQAPPMPDITVEAPPAPPAPIPMWALLLVIILGVILVIAIIILVMRTTRI